METYDFYTLPYCAPDKIVRKFPTLGEALNGIELSQSPIELRFRENVKRKVICQKKLAKDFVSAFELAINHQYWYQLTIDELPMWAMVGGVFKDKSSGETIPYIYTHKAFSIGYNQNRIVEVNLTALTPTPLHVSPGSDESIEFTYSVKWVESPVPFENRFRRYLENNFFEHRIHWFSIFNSFLVVLFLSGLVFMILLRTLRSDYVKYAAQVQDQEDQYNFDSDIEAEFTDDSGWKQVHGDVFRQPPNLELLSALLGTGYQLTLIALFLIVFAILYSVYHSPGSLTTFGVVVYVFTTIISGFWSGSTYSKNAGRRWRTVTILTATLFPGVVSLVAFTLNWLALAYNSLIAIPFLTMIVVALLWMFVSVPLVFVGMLLGRKLNGKQQNPCRVNPIPRVIVSQPWYRSRGMFVLLGGILPFGSIFIEMYFIFTSFWNYKFYYVYGFMLLVFIILIIVTMCVSMIGTYFLLNLEDYRWQWTSFLLSASTAFYVFLYAVYFYFFKTSMSGLLQLCFYFGYMGLFCLALGILCGAIGFLGAKVFVRMIYSNIKVD